MHTCVCVHCGRRMQLKDYATKMMARVKENVDVVQHGKVRGCMDEWADVVVCSYVCMHACMYVWEYGCDR